MIKVARFFVVVVAGAAVASCGVLAGGCSGVDVNTDHDDYFDWVDVSVRNTSDEPKLVTLAVVGSDGSEIATHTMRVDSKDIAETRVTNMRARDGSTVELLSCE